MRRGDVYRTQQRLAERGDKPGFYVIVSRDFIARNKDVSTVVCAPAYSQILGIKSEVVLGTEDSLPQPSAIRCDFLTLMETHPVHRDAVRKTDRRTRGGSCLFPGAEARGRSLSASSILRNPSEFKKVQDTNLHNLSKRCGLPRIFSPDYPEAVCGRTLG